MLEREVARTCLDLSLSVTQNPLQPLLVALGWSKAGVVLRLPPLLCQLGTASAVGFLVFLPVGPLWLCHDLGAGARREDLPTSAATVPRQAQCFCLLKHPALRLPHHQISQGHCQPWAGPHILNPDAICRQPLLDRGQREWEGEEVLVLEGWGC